MDQLKVLVIGGGGREHALAWRLARSESVKEIHAAPGNPGIAEIGTCHAPSDYLAIAKELNVDLTVVGPEAPLVAGIVDQFRANRMAIVGPVAANAALEGSKVHAKRFMQQLGVPTARFFVATSAAQAYDALRDFRYPLVLKTDGLAAGKGVVVAHTMAEVEAALSTLPVPLVMEEFLVGEEVSFIALCDGRNVVPLEPSQDHKRVFDGDQGPNTGGMGAYSDSRILSASDRSLVLEKIILPVVRATGFTGFLYAGLMMTDRGPEVLEFNVRLGDPETQPLMMRMESDWGEALLAAARGELRENAVSWSAHAAACVVMASHGYPGAFATGMKISGLGDVKDAMVFQAGTKRDIASGELLTAGGRVLGVTATGDDLAVSLERAYAAVNCIHFDGAQYRKDIGRLGLRRTQSTLQSQ
jgi:phosphoribosylamine--glycine ligase